MLYIDIRIFTCYDVTIEREVIHMPMKPKEMIKLLQKNGFIKISQNGSHVKMLNQETGKQTIVPLHSKDLKRGIEQSILKQAGLK